LIAQPQKHQTVPGSVSPGVALVFSVVVDGSGIGIIGNTGIIGFLNLRLKDIEGAGHKIHS